MKDVIAGFDWDEGNTEKCQKHGVSLGEIEALFQSSIAVRPDLAHSASEARFQAIGQTPKGRYIFLVFTIRQHGEGNYVRPISARYMHKQEVEAYEKAHSGL